MSSSWTFAMVGPLLQAAPSPGASASPAPASFGAGVINFSFLLSVALEEKVNVNGIVCQTRDFSLVSARYF